MPPGHGSGKAPRDLADDPIEDFPVIKYRGEELEDRYLPTNYAKDKPEVKPDVIARPTNSRRNLGGPLRPRDTLHSPRTKNSTAHLDLSKKRTSELASSPRSPLKRQKLKPKELASPQETTGSEEMQPHFRTKNASVELLSDFIDCLPSGNPCEKRVKSLSLENIKTDTKPKPIDGWKPSNGNAARPTARKVRGLLSQQPKIKQNNWQLNAFQRGTLQRDTRGPHKLQLVGKRQLKVPKAPTRFYLSVNDEIHENTGFSSDEIRKVTYCEKTREFRPIITNRQSISGGQYISFSFISIEDFQEAFCYFQDLNLKMEEFDDKDLTKPKVNPLEYFSRLESPQPLVQDTVDTAPEQTGEDSARKLQPDSRRRSTRTNPSIDGVTVEPRNTRSKKKYLQDGTPDKKREIHSVKLPKLDLPYPEWKNPLLYPFQGQKRANVEYGDLRRLQGTEFLNDNLINFYLRYLEEDLIEKNPQLARETHFFNTFFYERLKMKGDPGKGMQGILKWTSKIDLFSKNYIIIPICENAHWYLAIVCNLQHLQRRLQYSSPIEEDSREDSDTTISAEKKPQDSIENPEVDPDNQDVPETESSAERMTIDEEWPAEDENEGLDEAIETKNKKAVITVNESSSEASTPRQKVKNSKKVVASKKQPLPPDTPVIIILDSMSGGTGRRPTTSKNLKEWLQKEAKEKRGIAINTNDIKATYPKAPNQNNYYDCGLFVLHYAQRFLARAKDFLSAFLCKDSHIDKELWQIDDILTMRERMFKMIVDLHTKFEENNERIKIEQVSKSAAPNKDFDFENRGEIEKDLMVSVQIIKESNAPGRHNAEDHDSSVRTEHSRELENKQRMSFEL